MSISYSGLTNYGKATLPSAESWGTNMNILRDPPKSITTRRIDKVGQTSEITTMIDDSTIIIILVYYYYVLCTITITITITSISISISISIISIYTYTYIYIVIAVVSS